VLFLSWKVSLAAVFRALHSFILYVMKGAQKAAENQKAFVQDVF
jgi:hypothetical protein